MRNPMDANEVRNRQHSPKNNLFCYRWRVLDNSNKSNDRQAFHLSHQTADNHFSLMSDKFLQLYKSRFTSSRNDLIVDLAQDAIKFLNRRKHEHFELTKVEVMLSKAVQELMERVFNTLLSFSTELNSVLGLSELFISATEPEIKKRSNSSEASIALCIQAHLSTSLFRLVMEGRHDHICFYLVPADNIVAIQDLARQYVPVAAWKAQFASQGHVYWLSPAGVLTEEMIDVACAELLRHLIETTQEAIVPGCTAEPVDHTYRHYDISDADPWTQESPYDKVADLMRESVQFEPTLSIDRPGDRQLPRATQRWNVLNESTSCVAWNCNNAVISEPGCFSLTITNANEDDRCSPSPRSVHASDHSGDRSLAKCDGTRTDSVPSLNSLLKESAVFTAAPQEPAFVASTPVSVAGKSELFDAAKHGFVPGMRGSFDAAKTGFALGMNDLLNVADCGSLPGISGVLKVSNVSSAAPNEVPQKVDFDLSTADFEESSTKRKRGVATKRSTKKTASRTARKKSK